MPRYTTSQTFTEGNTQIVALPDPTDAAAATSKNEQAIVLAENNPQSLFALEEEPYEEKIKRISEMVPTRVYNTSGSSAGSGSGDFHQYRAMRRHEQDRLIRMEKDYQNRKEAAEFLERRQNAMELAEEKTAKKRLKRQKKKEKRKKLKVKGNETGEENQKHATRSSSESEGEKVKAKAESKLQTKGDLNAEKFSARATQPELD